MKGGWMVAGAVLIATLSACAHQKTGAPALETLSRSVPSAQFTPPPGDIPDTQQFVTYASPQGYRVLFPEGWSRSAAPGGSVTFVWHFDGERLSAYRSTSRPAAAASDPAVAAVLHEFGDAHAAKVFRQKLPGGYAVVVRFTSRSQADAVTGRRIRLENQSYLFHRGNQTIALGLWAPAGSDNVDQWRRISRSFRWQ